MPCVGLQHQFISWTTSSNTLTEFSLAPAVAVYAVVIPWISAMAKETKKQWKGASSASGPPKPSMTLAAADTPSTVTPPAGAQQKADAFVQFEVEDVEVPSDAMSTDAPAMTNLLTPSPLGLVQPKSAERRTHQSSSQTKMRGWWGSGWSRRRSSSTTRV